MVVWPGGASVRGMDSRENAARRDDLITSPMPHELARDAMDGSTIPMETLETAGAAAPSEPLAERIANAALRRGIRVGVAESLTSGAIAAALGAATDAGEWFSGGIVAYRPEVKFNVLGVPLGPVITADAAREMASGCARVLGSTASVAVTGAGGPGSQEGQRAGTVFIAVHTDQGEIVQQCWFPGDPGAVLENTIETALELLATQLEAVTGDRSQKTE